MRVFKVYLTSARTNADTPPGRGGWRLHGRVGGGCVRAAGLAGEEQHAGVSGDGSGVVEEVDVGPYYLWRVKDSKTFRPSKKVTTVGQASDVAILGPFRVKLKQIEKSNHIRDTE